MRSYTIHTAIYDPRKDCVDTISYGSLDILFEELFDASRRNEIIDTIHKYVKQRKMC
jgi:hypothetical protein